MCAWKFMLVFQSQVENSWKCNLPIIFFITMTWTFKKKCLLGRILGSTCYVKVGMQSCYRMLGCKCFKINWQFTHYLFYDLQSLKQLLYFYNSLFSFAVVLPLAYAPENGLKHLNSRCDECDRFLWSVKLYEATFHSITFPSPQLPVFIWKDYAWIKTLLDVGTNKNYFTRKN